MKFTPFCRSDHPKVGHYHSDSIMNRLSLSKRQNIKMDVDNLPCNQEEFAKMQNELEDQFDYGLNLTDFNSPDVKSDNFTDSVSIACDNFTEKLGTRHQLACAREGIYFSMRNDTLPPFMKWNISCNPNLGDKDIEIGFQSLWKEKTDFLKKEFMQESIKFLEEKIEQTNNELREIRQEALQKIGTATSSAGLARNEMNTRMNASKEKFDKELLQFCTAIRTKRKQGVVKNKPTTGSSYRGGKGKGHKGRKFSPY